jgi:hypothetical protein
VFVRNLRGAGALWLGLEGGFRLASSAFEVGGYGEVFRPAPALARFGAGIELPL